MKKISLIFVSLILVAAAGPVVFAQSQPVRIYLAPDDHTDYMWTANEAQYRAAFLEMLDYYLDQIDATAGNAPEWQARWNCDGSYWVKAYEESRPVAAFERLLRRIRDGHISVPLNVLSECYGAQPTEAVLRGMFHAGSLERKYNLNLKLAVSQENQTLPYGLGALWAGAGARYSWKGVCNCATKISDLRFRQHDIYWWTGLDGSRILMKWNSLMAGNESIGGYAESRNPGAIVDLLDGSATFKSRYPYAVIGAFGQGWDDLKTLTTEFVSTALGKTNATRKVIVSNQEDFFQDFEAQYGATLPSQACSFGNEWDILSASMAEVSARVRRAVEKLRAAEALATLVSIKSPAFMRAREAARDLAWLDLGLYWEHDWTADGTSVSRAERAAWQRRLAGEIEQYVNTLQTDAALALGRMIPAPAPTTRFYVFNPLGWSRSDQADLPWSDTNPVRVIEVAGGAEVPSQIVTVDGQRRLRVLAEAVPPVGYKVYEILPGSPGAFGNAATVTSMTIENAYYKATLDGRGAITSLVDKTRGGREFVQTVGGRALNDLGPGSGSVTVENAGAVSVTLKATAAAPVAHTTRLTLTRGLNRIALRNEIEQNFGGVLTWGFGLALPSPDVWHEEVGAVIRARTLDQGGHYATRNARYDWLTLNHFADISGGGAGLTLANADCSFMKLGASTADTLDSSTPLVSVLAGGQVDGAALGIPNQDGDTHFLQSFALMTHDSFNQAEAMRFAMETQNPLVAEPVTGGSAYPADQYSLIAISNPDVLLWALKPAEDGIDKAGIVARVWNMAPGTAQFELGFVNEPLVDTTLTTHLEVAQGRATLVNGQLSATLAPQQLQSWQFRIKSLGFSRSRIEPYP